MNGDWLRGMDTAIFRAINGLDLGPWDRIWVWVTSVRFGVACGVAWVLYCIWRKKWEAAWIIAAGLLAVTLSDFIGARAIKPFFARMRPPYALPPGTVRLLVASVPSFSFPSLHAANSTAMAVVAYLSEKRSGYVLFPVAALISISRVKVGVHWPSDLLAGALWGLVCALTSWSLLKIAKSMYSKRRSDVNAARSGKA